MDPSSCVNTAAPRDDDHFRIYPVVYYYRIDEGGYIGIPGRIFYKYHLKANTTKIYSWNHTLKYISGNILNYDDNLAKLK